jgi:hypothetical protein
MRPNRVDRHGRKTVVSDAATRWVAPFFMHVPNQYPASVSVLNLGPGAAQVTVTFYHSYGVKAEAVAKTVDVSTGELFTTDVNLLGWVLVDSDRPVFPAGQTFAAGTAYASEIIPLTFYRAEGVDIEDWVRISAKDLKALGGSG